MEDDHGMRRSVEELRQTFKSGKTRGVDWRKSQLRAILRLIEENKDNLYQLLQSELGKHPVESYRDEVSLLLNSNLFMTHTISQNFEKFQLIYENYRLFLILCYDYDIFVF